METEIFLLSGPQMPAGLQPGVQMVGVAGMPGMAGIMQPALIPGLRQPYLTPG